MQTQRRTSPPAAQPQSSAPVSGSTYRFLVRSAEEAAGVIRDQLGEHTRVVSVRAVKAPGWSGFLGGTRIEVIAQVQPPAPTIPEAAGPAPATPAAESAVATAGPLYTAASTRANAPEKSSAASDSDGSVSSGRRESARAETAVPATPARNRRNPPPQRIETLLRRSGLSEPLIERLQPLGASAAVSDQPLHLGLSAIADEIRSLAGAAKAKPLPPRAAFIGMSGVGRTTALCKWLSSEVFGQGRVGAVATVEFDRPHANEDLAVFAELLGLGFARQTLPVDRTGAAFSYFDLPPLSLTRPEENEKLREYLDDQAIPGRVLVLSALHDPALLRQACAIGQDLGCTHLVFTHLDELPLWGKLWDFLIDAPLTPLLLSLGPSQTGECETDVVGAALRRTFPWN